MRKLIACVATAAVLLVGALRAEARIVVSVDKSSQRMSVSVDGVARYVWEVSTGRENFSTPTGIYRPELLERTHFSRKYYDSPMPYSIFFHRGYAIHGSYEISKLGGPASHGCIRLHPQNAATLFSLVQQHGSGATTIIVSEGNLSYGRRSPPLEARYGKTVEAAAPARNEPRRYHGVARDLVYEDDDWSRWGRSRRY
jgi:hypothetical protein